jgi:hypothetical protein
VSRIEQIKAAEKNLEKQRKLVPLLGESLACLVVLYAADVGMKGMFSFGFRIRFLCEMLKKIYDTKTGNIIVACCRERRMVEACITVMSTLFSSLAYIQGLAKGFFLYGTVSKVSQDSDGVIFSLRVSQCSERGP